MIKTQKQINFRVVHRQGSQRGVEYAQIRHSRGARITQRRSPGGGSTQLFNAIYIVL